MQKNWHSPVYYFNTIESSFSELQTQGKNPMLEIFRESYKRKNPSIRSKLRRSEPMMICSNCCGIALISAFVPVSSKDEPDIMKIKSSSSYRSRILSQVKVKRLKEYNICDLRSRCHSPNHYHRISLLREPKYNPYNPPHSLFI